jgi:FkbM family methyltransferase
MRNPISLFKSYSEWYGHPNWLVMISAQAIGVPSIAEVRPPQTVHPVFLRTGTTDVPMYHQVFTSRQYKVALSKHPKTVLDCGGNVGFASVYLANVYPGAKILSIEPELSNYNLLTRNVAPYPNIVPLHAAVWKTNTLLDIRDQRGEACSFQTQEYGMQGSGRLVGRTVGLTIDSIMKLAGMDEVDFLKIDVEGTEDELFADPNAWIQRVGVMAIEIHDDMKPNCRATIYRNAARHFAFEWHNGENVFFARSDFVDQVALATGWQPIGQSG